MLTILRTLSPEPVTLVQAKAAARLDADVSALDTSIEAAISAAREQAEHITGRRYRSVELRAELADWPALDQVLPVCAAWACAISYWTGTAWAQLAAEAFAFGPAGLGGNSTAVLPANGIWPTLGARVLGPRVRIDLSAGPLVVLDSSVPPKPLPPAVAACVQQYICAHVGAWLKAPEGLISANLAPNPLFERLLDAERLYA